MQTEKSWCGSNKPICVQQQPCCCTHRSLITLCFVRRCRVCQKMVDADQHRKPADWVKRCGGMCHVTCRSLHVACCMSLVPCAKSLALAVPYHPEDKDEHNTFDKWVKNQKILLALQAGQVVDLTMPVSALVSHPACATHLSACGRRSMLRRMLLLRWSRAVSCSPRARHMCPLVSSTRPCAVSNNSVLAID